MMSDGVTIISNIPMISGNITDENLEIHKSIIQSINTSDRRFSVSELSIQYTYQNIIYNCYTNDDNKIFTSNFKYIYEINKLKISNISCDIIGQLLNMLTHIPFKKIHIYSCDLSSEKIKDLTKLIINNIFVDKVTIEQCIVSDITFNQEIFEISRMKKISDLSIIQLIQNYSSVGIRTGNLILDRHNISFIDSLDPNNNVKYLYLMVDSLQSITQYISKDTILENLVLVYFARGCNENIEHQIKSFFNEITQNTTLKSLDFSTGHQIDINNICNILRDINEKNFNALECIKIAYDMRMISSADLEELSTVLEDNFSVMSIQNSIYERGMTDLFPNESIKNIEYINNIVARNKSLYQEKRFKNTKCVYNSCHQ